MARDHRALCVNRDPESQDNGIGLVGAVGKPFRVGALGKVVHDDLAPSVQKPARSKEKIDAP
jgi:hypothetical protein